MPSVAAAKIDSNPVARHHSKQSPRWRRMAASDGSVFRHTDSSKEWSYYGFAAP